MSSNLIRWVVILLIGAAAIYLRFENMRASGNFSATDTLVWEAQGSADAQGFISYRCRNATGEFYVETSFCESRLGKP